MQTDIAIQLEDLIKVFGRGSKRVKALKGIDLTVQRGLMFGFLGPNGAGKTTTIRLIMDLIRPSQGSVRVFGQDVRRQHGVLRNVGAIVEQASFYPFLTGGKNLEVIADVGDHDPKRIPELLNRVGLSSHANKRLSSYSTGMRQRLGLAAALLGDPQLLLLDEPTAGLDPAGMHEVRTYLRELVDHQQKTVFLSSHLLAEVEQVCDRVAIIHRGEIIREGKVSDLLHGQTQLRIQVSPLPAAQQALEGNWEISESNVEKESQASESGWVTLASSKTEAPKIVRCLVDAGVDIYQLTTQSKTLEAYFLEATEEESNRD